jgi:hypothetical protein
MIPKQISKGDNHYLKNSSHLEWRVGLSDTILFSDWLMLKKSSPLKQLGQMEPSLAGSIYVRSKRGIDGPWVCPFQNCVRQAHPPFKMAAVF